MYLGGRKPSLGAPANKTQENQKWTAPPSYTDNATMMIVAEFTAIDLSKQEPLYSFPKKTENSEIVFQCEDIINNMK